MHVAAPDQPGRAGLYGPPTIRILRPQTASVFVAATMSKAWEPLSVAVAHGGPAYSFPAALVLCEAAKVVLLLPLLAFGPSSEKIGWKESFRLYGLPAVALADVPERCTTTEACFPVEVGTYTFNEDGTKVASGSYSGAIAPALMMPT